MNQPPVEPTTSNLRVTPYDRVTGMLIALLVIVGLFVFVLLLLWLADKALGGKPMPTVELLDQPFGRGDHAEGLARDIEEPGVEELADVTRPQLADTLAAVTTAVTAQAATLDEMVGDSAVVGQGRGQGDSRSAGDGGEGDPDVIPRWERWELRLRFRDIAEYSRYLDFFAAELCAFGGGRPEVDYAGKFTRDKPVTRTTDGGGDRRLRMNPKSGQGTEQFDRQLMKQAGFDLANRSIVTFYPKSLEEQLSRLEHNASGGRALREIRKTVFSVQSTPDGFAFTVQQQDFR